MDDLRQISAWWQERMRGAVHDLPSQWVEAAFSKLTRDEVTY
jgi:putative proteasome-type protease